MHRILFHFGPVTIYSYGTLVALAFLVATYLSWKRATREGINPEIIIDAGLYILISGILGARLLYILIYYEYYFNHPGDILKIWQGGLIFYGGFILACFTTSFYLLKRRIPVWKFADLVAPNISLGLAIGRIGCFLNGCCFGRISEKFGFLFCCKDNPPVCLSQITQGLLPPGSQFSLPVIPTQLYSSFFCLFLFLILVVLKDNKNLFWYFSKRKGMFFWLFVFLYSFFRFFIEKFRFYDANFYFFSLTLSQLISLSLILGASMVLVVLDRWPRRQYSD